MTEGQANEEKEAKTQSKNDNDISKGSVITDGEVVVEMEEKNPRLRMENSKNGKTSDQGKLQDVEEDSKTEETHSPSKLSSVFQKFKDWKILQRNGKSKDVNDAEAGQSSKDVEPKENGQMAMEEGTGKETPKTNKKEETNDGKNGSGKSATNAEQTAKDEPKSRNKIVDKFASLSAKTKILILALTVTFIGIIILIIIFTQLPTADEKSQIRPELLVEEPIAQTSCGSVRGKTSKRNTIEFYGIPYALPPIGWHRFGLPRSPSSLEECWNGILDTRFQAPLCPQEPIPTMPEVQYSEDCLTLDVMTSSVDSREHNPVVVYIPGMSLLGFTEFDVKYRPSGTLSDQMKAVFVTVRYRTGPLGFMALDVLAEKSYPKVSGNYGLHDIVAALKWVHVNINHFGGDPKKVTVIGHGSSASLILSLMASQKLNYTYTGIQNDGMKIINERLFNQAWMTGGSINFSNKTLFNSYSDNLEFMDNLKCRTADCLYNSTFEAIVSATPKAWKNTNFHTMPQYYDEQPRIIVQDGVIVNKTPLEAMADGSLAKIPTVFGSVFHEHESRSAPNLNSWLDFESFIRTKLRPFGQNLTEEVIQMYIDDKTTPLHQYYSVVTDIRITCPIHQFANNYSQYFDSDSVYKYLVHYEYSKPNNFKNKTYTMAGTHGLDIASIFHLLPEFLNDNSIDTEWMLEATIQQTFFDFIHENHERYDLKSSKYTNIIDNDGKLHPVLDGYKNCELWDRSDLLPSYGRVN